MHGALRNRGASPVTNPVGSTPPSTRQPCPRGDAQQCLGTLLVVTLEKGVCARTPWPPPARCARHPDTQRRPHRRDGSLPPKAALLRAWTLVYTEEETGARARDSLSCPRWPGLGGSWSTQACPPALRFPEAYLLLPSGTFLLPRRDKLHFRSKAGARLVMQVSEEGWVGTHPTTATGAATHNPMGTKGTQPRMAHAASSSRKTRNLALTSPFT